MLRRGVRRYRRASAAPVRAAACGLRIEVPVLGMPFRAGAAHIVQVGAINAFRLARGHPDIAKNHREPAQHDTLPCSFAYEVRSREFRPRTRFHRIFCLLSMGQPTRGRFNFSNVCLTIILRQKSLKFVAISAASSPNCGQALRSFTGNREKAAADAVSRCDAEHKRARSACSRRNRLNLKQVCISAAQPGAACRPWAAASRAPRASACGRAPDESGRRGSKWRGSRSPRSWRSSPRCRCAGRRRTA